MNHFLIQYDIVTNMLVDSADSNSPAGLTALVGKLEFGHHLFAGFELAEVAV